MDTVADHLRAQTCDWQHVDPQVLVEVGILPRPHDNREELRPGVAGRRVGSDLARQAAERVGYKGFSEFQYQFRSDLEERDENLTGSKSDAYTELLRKVERDVPDALLCDLARRMGDASTVVATVASLSRIPAYHLFVMASALLGKGLYLNADEFTSHIGSDCVLFVFSVNSGFAYRKVLGKIREQKCPPYVVLVTMNPHHTLAKHADQVVVLPRLLSGESLGVGTADSMAFLMFLELLTGHLGS